MNFKQLSELIIRVTGVRESGIGISHSRESSDESEMWTLSEHYMQKPIAGHFINVIAGDDESDRVYSIEEFVCRCTDPSAQEDYETRLILSCLGVPNKQESLKDPYVLLVESSALPISEKGRIIYIEQNSVYTITHTEDSRIILNIANEKSGYISKWALIIGDSYDDGSWAWTSQDTTKASWLSEIYSVGDLYKSPLNQHFHATVNYLEDKRAYWGEHITFIPELMAALKVEGIWVKLAPEWIPFYPDRLPEKAKAEYRMVMSIADQK